MLMEGIEGGFSESQMGGDSNSHLGPADDSNQSPILAEGKADFEWSAAREATEALMDHHLNGNQVEEESDDNSNNEKLNEDGSADERSSDSKRPCQCDFTQDDSNLSE